MRVRRLRRAAAFLRAGGGGRSTTLGVRDMPGDLLAALALTWNGNGAPILAACRFLLVLRATRAPRIGRLDGGSRRDASARGGALSSDAPARLDISRDVDAARAREALRTVVIRQGLHFFALSLSSRRENWLI